MMPVVALPKLGVVVMHVMHVGHRARDVRESANDAEAALT